MQEVRLTESKIKKRVASGILVFGVRKVLFQTILTTSNIVLARILAPKMFGAYAIIFFLVSIVGILTTFGLGPAIVQRKGKLVLDQLRAIFTTQVLAAVIFAIIIFLLAPLINSLYKEGFGPEGVLWLRLFSLTLLFGNTAAISTFILERNLEYKKIAIGSVLTILLSQTLIIYFALKGFGIGSFVLGNVISSFIAFFVYFYLAPWKIGFNFKLKNLKPFLPFGLNYQLNSFVGIVNGAVLPVFVGAVSGARAVGLVSWAGGLRQAGLAPFEVVKDLLFPAASRAQTNKKLLKNLVEKMIELSSMFSFPVMAIMLALAPQLTYIIYTSNWLPGLTALYLSLIQGIFLLIGALLVDVLLALGRAKTVKNISIFWAILQWALTVPLVLLWNFNGVVLAGLLVSLTFFIPLRYVRREVQIDIWPKSIPYLSYSIAAGIVTYLFASFVVVESVFELMMVSGVGVLSYVFILILLKRDSIKTDYLIFRSLVFGK